MSLLDRLHRASAAERSLAGLLLAGAFIWIGVWAVNHYFDALIMNEIRSEMGTRLAYVAGIANDELSGSTSDIRVLTSLPSILPFLEHPTAASRQQLTAEFSAFARGKARYDQVRLLSATGRELIRVNFNKGVSVVVPRAELQDKSRRYYFRDALEYPVGGVFISRLDLNIEHGVVERPFKPMIRFATPVYDADGKVQGVIVLNYLAGQILDKMNAAFGGKLDASFMLLNADGYWLKYAGHQNREWGFMFNSNDTFGRAFPKAWRGISQSTSGSEWVPRGFLVYNTVANTLLNPTPVSRPSQSETSGIASKEMLRNWKEIAYVPGPAVARLEREPLVIVVGSGAILSALCVLLIVLTFRSRARRVHAEEEARSLSLVVSQSPVAVVISDGRGKVEYANPFFSELTGYELEEIIGTNLQDLSRRYGDSMLFASLSECARSGGSWQGRLLDRNRDGEERWQAVTVSAIRGPANRVSQLVAYVQDATESARHEEEIRRSAAEVYDLYNNAPCGYHSVDESGRFLNMNDTELAWLGYERDEVIGKLGILDLLEPERAETFKRGFERFKESGRVDNLEVELVCKNGLRIQVLVSSTVIYDEAGRYSSNRSVLVDNTEKREMVEQLRRAKHDAEEASLAKSNFLANMSHEIRTPMNVVIGFSELAMKSKLPPRQHDYVSKVHGAAVSLLALIDDILDFSKIEANRLDLELAEFSLEGVLESACSFVSTQVSEKGLELLLNLPPSIPHQLVGDAHRLSQILVNLASNAAKFTHEGEIELAVRERRRQGEEIDLEFFVRDTGIGLTEEEIGRLFEPFSQADNTTTRKYGGTGLGLSICRRLVELMGGRIWVESRKGEGSTFRFTVPLRVGESNIPPAQLPGNIRGARVLITDDNPSALRLMAEMLLSVGFRVGRVTSGTDAIEALVEADATDPYRFVLMDWRMPGMDGIEATARITSDDRIHHRCSVFILSAFGTGEGEAALSREAGAADFLSKPVSASTIVNAFMREAIESGKSGEARESPYSGGSSLKGARVLLVDDNELNLDLASEILGGEGVLIETASDGAQAIAQMRRHRGAFDLVLMDIQMPGMDGYATTRKIRENPDYDDVPIVAVTAHALADDRRRVIEAGMADHLTKPLNLEKLFAVLKAHYRGPEREGDAEIEPVQWLADSGPEQGHLDSGRAARMLSRLRELVVTNDTGALYELDAMRRLRGTRISGDDFDRLQERIRRYDFEAALYHIDSILRSLRRAGSTDDREEI